MVTQRTSFAKMQRDRDKQTKAAAKRDRRKERTTDEVDVDITPLLDSSGGELSASELLKLVETVHQQFDDGVIDFDTFEENKAAILSRIRVD